MIIEFRAEAEIKSLAIDQARFSAEIAVKVTSDRRNWVAGTVLLTPSEDRNRPGYTRYSNDPHSWISDFLLLEIRALASSDGAALREMLSIVEDTAAMAIRDFSNVEIWQAVSIQPVTGK